MSSNETRPTQNRANRGERYDPVARTGSKEQDIALRSGTRRAETLITTSMVIGRTWRTDLMNDTRTRPNSGVPCRFLRAAIVR